MFLIVSGGEPPSRELLAAMASKAECIIAADRGARYCVDAGVTPDLVVGDMDSLDEGVLRRLGQSGVEVVRFSPDKDRTDTEIALEEALRRGALQIGILGALGGRLDHALANVHLLRAAARRGAEARIVTDSQEAFLVDSRCDLGYGNGRTVSFLPLTDRVRGVTLEGFDYELVDADMEMGRPYGVSNRVRSAQARVSVKEGVLLAVLAAEGEGGSSGSDRT